jgi:hypothetical protein
VEVYFYPQEEISDEEDWVSPQDFEAKEESDDKK